MFIEKKVNQKCALVLNISLPSYVRKSYAENTFYYVISSLFKLHISFFYGKISRIMATSLYSNEIGGPLSSKIHQMDCLRAKRKENHEWQLNDKEANLKSLGLEPPAELSTPVAFLMKIASFYWAHFQLGLFMSTKTYYLNTAFIG